MGAMHLISLIDSDLIYLKSNLKDLREIYTYMVNQKNKKYPSNYNTDDLVDMLLKKDLKDCVLISSGIHIPHLHLDDYRDTIISILMPEKPIETEAGIIKVFFMVFTCSSDKSLYLHILQSLVKLIKNESLYNRILNASSISDLRKAVSEEKLYVKKAITVDDVMVTNVLTVTKNTTLKELSQLFYEHNFGYFPVLDDKSKVCGEVSISDYMMAAFPAYTHSLQNLSFLKSFEPFERLIKDEDKLTVKNIMKPLEVHIKPDASLIEAVFLINKFKRRDLPVLDHGNLVGIISFMNIFRKVIKG